MPLAERDDDAFGGTVVTLTPPDGLDALPDALRNVLPEALVAAFEDPAAQLAEAVKTVGLPGFAAFCAALGTRAAALEIATDSFAHDDEMRLVFGTLPATEDAAAEAGVDTGADDLPAPPSLDDVLQNPNATSEDVWAAFSRKHRSKLSSDLDLGDLEAALPEGTLPPEMKAQMDALGAKMQRALAPPKAVGAATAEAAALSFAPPVVMDAPPLLRAIYYAVGTIRLGPPGSPAGLVAAQPADYRLEMADPDYLAVFETATGDVLATTEDGAAAVWLRTDDAGETPVPAGTLADALDAVFVALAEGRMPAAPER